MARRGSTRTEVGSSAVLLADGVSRHLSRGTFQQVVQTGMEEAVGAGRQERTEDRPGHRAGIGGGRW